ncbi:MAG: hypothetical protein H7Z43_03555 [Clostridia bacterium]|nr:hypothetical protein [Deltaproteobacteria bacterium]
MRHVLVSVLVLTGFTACSVGVGNEAEIATINRAGVRVFNAIVNAPVLGVRVTPDANVDDAPSFSPLQATQYIGLDSGGFVLRAGSGDALTFTPVQSTLGTGASPDRLDAQDRWLAILSGSPLAPRTPFYRERRNDGQFLIGDSEAEPSPNQTNLRIINATADFTSVHIAIDRAGVDARLGLDEDVRLNVPADTAFLLAATASYGIPEIAVTYGATLPALPGGSDATLVAVGLGGGTGANALRFIYLPNRQGSIAPPPVDLGVSPSVVIVNALGTSASVTAASQTDTLTLAIGAASARLQVPNNLLITANGAALTPVTLDTGGSYVIVLAPALSGNGVSAYAYSDDAAVSTVRALNFIVGPLAPDVALGTTVLATGLVYGAASAAVARPPLGSLTATADASTYTFPVSTAAPRYYILTGDATSTVSVIVVDDASAAVLVGGTKS